MWYISLLAPEAKRYESEENRCKVVVRVYECPNCGLVIDRDHNSSVNILVEAVGRHGCVIPEASAL